MSTLTGEIKRQSTRQQIQHSIGGSDVGGEAAKSVQEVWNDNKNALRKAFCNGFGQSANSTLWLEGNFRLDLQSTDSRATRFAFQEGNKVHGQVHLLSIPADAKIPVPEIADEQERKKWTKDQQVNWSKS